MPLYKTIVKKVSIPQDKKVKQKNYEEVGQLAVVDQGKDIIGGYSNDFDKRIECDLPVVVFGDHTCTVKYINFPFAAGADGIKILEPKDNVVPKYLYYGTKYLTLWFPEKGYARHYQHIEKMDLFLSTVSEQRRIVSRIEELFSKLDKGVETLQTIKQQLAVYRQAVLKETFSNVLGEKALIKDVCNAIKVGIVIKPTQYYVQTGGVFAFRNSNVRRGCIEDKDWVMISKSGHHANSRSEVHAGDVLISRSGVNLGMAAVVPERFDGYNAIDVIIAVPEQTKLLPEYLVHYTNSPYGQEIVKERERGAAQAHLNVKVYGNLPISIPTMEVQKEVVTKIEKQLSLCDNIEQTVDEALAQADAMRQSILKRAFEGKL